MDLDEPQRVAEQLYAALEADEIPRFLELCADDVTFRYPAEGRLPYGGPWEGRDGVARFMDVHDAAAEILAFDVHQMLAEGDTVFALGEFSGRAKPDGREWSTRFVHRLIITDGLLRRWEAFSTPRRPSMRAPVRSPTVDAARRVRPWSRFGLRRRFATGTRNGQAASPSRTSLHRTFRRSVG